jgi:hypothetical protein
MAFDEISYFTIGRTQTRIADPISKARAKFATQRALVCRPGVDKELLAMLTGASVRAAFRPQPVEGIGHRYVETPPLVGNAIQLALNRRELMDWLVAVTDCGPISHIEGRLVQTRPDGEDGLDWHRDTHANMVLGMAVHLADCACEGGAFELRERGASKLLFRHADAQAGDVAIFDIDNRFEHRVCRVVSGGPRTVFTGWFMAAKTE